MKIRFGYRRMMEMFRDIDRVDCYADETSQKHCSRVKRSVANSYIQDLNVLSMCTVRSVIQGKIIQNITSREVPIWVIYIITFKNLYSSLKTSCSLMHNVDRESRLKRLKSLVDHTRYPSKSILISKAVREKTMKLFCRTRLRACNVPYNMCLNNVKPTDFD